MEISTPSYPPTERTQVKRRSQRGVYDKEQVHAILDEGFVCHVGFVLDGQPFVIPTAYARSGETIYIHGSPASRLMKGKEVDVCLTVTLVDGLVLARSAFHTSINYRSVVVVGKARLVTDVIGAPRPRGHDASALMRSRHGAPGRSRQSWSPDGGAMAYLEALSRSWVLLSRNEARSGCTAKSSRLIAASAWSRIASGVKADRSAT